MRVLRNYGGSHLFIPQLQAARAATSPGLKRDWPIRVFGCSLTAEPTVSVTPPCLRRLRLRVHLWPLLLIICRWCTLVYFWVLLPLVVFNLCPVAAATTSGGADFAVDLMMTNMNLCLPLQLVVILYLFHFWFLPSFENITLLYYFSISLIFSCVNRHQVPLLCLNQKLCLTVFLYS